MHIKSLKLYNFRNYENLNFSFAKKFNIIYGDNGQGKTNILEAIFLCASGRSHRTSKDIDLVKIDRDGYSIKLNMIKEYSDSTIEINFDKGQKRKIKINDIPVRKVGDLMGHLNAVIFSPEDLLIIKEGPSERRRFIDITICQLKPSYFYDLQQYSKILTQRNSLLKEIQQKRYLMDTLEVWNNNLASIGSRIMRVRNEFINRLNGHAEKYHYKLSNGNEKLLIKYVPSFNLENLKDINSIQKSFLKSLEEVKVKELFKTTTLCGPQRDDYEVYLNGSNIKLYGSQGQQRTAILSIKLSEIDIMKEETGEYPILLLDDVMSELDKKRQEYLLQNMEGVQTFITCTDKAFFEQKENSDSSYIYVRKGQITIE